MCSLYCVWLLNRVDIKTLQPHHWFNVTFQCVQLSQPVPKQCIKKIKSQLHFLAFIVSFFLVRIFFLVRSFYSKFLRGNFNFQMSLPCNFSSPFCFFSHLIEFCISCALGKHLCLRWLQPMKCPLCMCPFKLTLFLPKIFLSCKGNL